MISKSLLLAILNIHGRVLQSLLLDGCDEVTRLSVGQLSQRLLKIRVLDVSWVRCFGDTGTTHHPPPAPSSPGKKDLNKLIQRTSVREISIFGCLMLSQGLLTDGTLHVNADGLKVALKGSEFN